MLSRPARTPGSPLRPTPSAIVAGVALFVALGGSAVAASDLVFSRDIAVGAVTSAKIKDGTIRAGDLSSGTRAALRGAKGDLGSPGVTGEAGAAGAAGTNGANGPTGSSGAAGSNGTAGAAGSNGSNGAAGANGAAGVNGANGPNGANGTNGVDGTNGIDGTNGTDGIDGTIAPLSAGAGLIALPTGTDQTLVVSLTVPAGKYVVLAKSQLSHTGAADSVDCFLKSAETVIDRVGTKTLPALAAVPASLQAVTPTLTSATVLSLSCVVTTANGTANHNSLIAIPTG